MMQTIAEASVGALIHTDETILLLDLPHIVTAAEAHLPPGFGEEWSPEQWEEFEILLATAIQDYEIMKLINEPDFFDVDEW